MNSAQLNVQFVTCPACGLLCDDVQVKSTDNAIKVQKNGCAKSLAFFEQVTPELQPTIAGKSATLKEAIAEVVRLLKQAKNPLLDGLSTDITGFRALFGLAQKTNAALRHTNATSIARNMRVLQSAGWQTTTLTEVKNHADVIVCFGSNIVAHNPRFFGRFIDMDGMFVSAKNRQVIVLGNTQKTSNIKSDALEAPWNLPCRPDDLPSVTIALRALVAGKALKASEIAGIQVTDLQKLANILKAAKYAVLAWVAKDLDFPHAELTIQNITETVATLNETTRAAGLALGGSDGDTSANYANAWLSGFVLDENIPDHDAVIWVNSFSVDKLPNNTPHPLIALGVAPPSNITPTVYIPIATPALDCAGMLFRVDGSVTLPLKKIRENHLPTLSEVISQIEALL
ncbi:MAG TPA: formylmethanofuran dehydrogenase [Methylotenera sp.]|nr:formylmethanofuran dehydrogenase [Methylotenera sp.]HPH04770.1 formylmethanofuran dehydrogenase [Methylotenera sp.]HPN01213.1 formylmethanofuran dehydrogenase [Methylotenera sp.]